VRADEMNKFIAEKQNAIMEETDIMDSDEFLEKFLNNEIP